MLLQSFPAECIIKIPCFQWINCHMQTVFQIIQIQSTHVKCFIADNLRRHKFVKLIHQFCLGIQFCHQIFPGCNIRNRKSVPVCHIDNTHNVIVLCFIQSLSIQVGSRCYYTDNFPFYNSFCCFRIFYLLTDCYLIAFWYQTVQITVNCMVRDSAHRCPFFQSAILSSQSNFQLFWCCESIVEEHFIKIS